MIFNGFMLRGLYQTLRASDAVPAWTMIVFIIGCIVAGYLLGSLNFAVMLSNMRYHDDIRNYGSGNGGATNMLRTYGKFAAFLTFLGDILKGMVAVTIGSALLGLTLGGHMAAFFCMLGHMFPIFYKFKGGKGVATSIGAIFMLSPFVALIMILVFAIIVIGTKYVSLGSIMAALVYPVLLYRINLIQDEAGWFVANNIGWGFDIIFSFLMMVMVVFMHRENIKRLTSGKESKVSFKKKTKGEEDGK